jgi:hypothetical protein
VRDDATARERPPAREPGQFRPVLAARSKADGLRGQRGAHRDTCAPTATRERGTPTTPGSTRWLRTRPPGVGWCWIW